MLGEKTERRFGWDCHGLPAEMEVEKELDIRGRLAIKEYGIEKFNEACRKSVQKYTAQWQEYVTKQARWVDFEKDYKTMDTDYMESTIWAFKTLYEKGLLYEDFRIMPYSWKCQTPLSNFETHLDNSYKQKKSKSIYVKFELEESPEFVIKNFPDAKKTYLVIWTTTPWTLPSNLSIAINPNINYKAFQQENEVLIVAENLFDKFINKINK